MKTSENITDLSAALAAAQGALTDPAKDQAGYQQRYFYADLAGINRIVRPVLAKHGLSLVQDVCATDTHIAVETSILHSSGQWMRFGPLTMQVDKLKGLTIAQCTGSAITYARRYAILGALGLAQDDDDGQSAGPAQTVEPTLPPVVKALFASIRTKDGQAPALWQAMTSDQHAWIMGHAPDDIAQDLQDLGGSNA